jgi:L-ascorbate metabolism protein UlaG (beta-lactamase superfamily)
MAKSTIRSYVDPKHHDPRTLTMNRRKFAKWALGGLALLGGGTTYTTMTNSYYSGPISDHFDGTRFFVPNTPPLNSISSLLSWQFGNDPKAVWPTSVQSPFADVPPQRVDTLRSVLIGHASFLIQINGVNILIDPLFGERASPVSFAGPKRVNPPGIAFEKLPPIDAVLVTHGHYDHMELASLSRLHQTYKPRFICPLGNDAVMASSIGGRQNAAAMDWGQSVDLGQGVQVHLVPSFHWSARSLTDRKKTLWASFVITAPNTTLYHIGDTGYGDGRFSRDVAKQFGRIDLAHIPIGAYEPRWFMKEQHVNPEEAVQILQDCGATRAIGHHWGTFQLTNEAIGQPETDLAAALTKAKISADRFQAFRPGQTLSL